MCVGCPAYHLTHGSLIHLISFKVVNYFIFGQSLQLVVEVHPVSEPGKIALQLCLKSRLSGYDNAYIRLVKDATEYLHLLLCVFVYELVCLINDEQEPFIGIEKLTDTVDSAPYRSTVPLRESYTVLNGFHQVPASHCVITLNVCHSWKLCIFLQGVCLSLTGLSNDYPKPHVLLTCLTHTNGLHKVSALKELHLLLECSCSCRYAVLRFLTFSNASGSGKKLSDLLLKLCRVTCILPIEVLTKCCS